MFYVLPDILLKVSLNTNGHMLYVIPDTLLKVSLKLVTMFYTITIVESVVKHQ